VEFLQADNALPARAARVPAPSTFRNSALLMELLLLGNA
jgi:hypothetical protein